MPPSAEKLQPYAELDGTQWGERCLTLIQLTKYRKYVAEELRKSLDLEIEELLIYAEENATIVPEIITTHRKVIQWRDE